MGNLTLYKYNPDPAKKDKWLELRKKLSGIGNPNHVAFGASDIGTILTREDGVTNYNDYLSKKEFFYHACEWAPIGKLQKLELYRGEVLEDIIYNNYWRYINPEAFNDHAGFIENVYGERKVFRRGRKYNYTISNKKYPWLYVNPDYQIFKCKHNPKGFLENKSPTWRAIEKYVSNTPPSYIFQCFTQMLVGEVDYSELLMVTDATTPELRPFEKNQAIYDKIIEQTHEFYLLVLEGKKIVYDPDMPLHEKEQALEDIAPAPDGSDSLTEFYTEQHKKKLQTVEVDGTDEMLDKVLAYLKKKSEIGDMTTDLKRLEQEIRSWYVGDIGKISFGDFGAISYYSKFNVPSRILKNFEGQAA